MEKLPGFLLSLLGLTWIAVGILVAWMIGSEYAQNFFLAQRYVDDFVILHDNKKQLEIWKEKINNFLKEKLKIDFHPQKSTIKSLYKGLDFLGFRVFQKHILLRKTN